MEGRAGARRTESADSADGDYNAFNAASKAGATVYRFSIQSDLSKPLNFSHEYKIVCFEPSDGTHVFDIYNGA